MDMDMDPQDFREFAISAIDFIINYEKNIRDWPVLPSIEPGYLQKLMPGEMPEKGEKWQDVMDDFKNVILPGVTHWQSPKFMAYFPSGQSFPSIVGDILAGGLASVGFSWITSPACTELEVAVMNWLGKLMDLPKEFLNCSEGPGGGIIQGSASEATLVALLAAKQRTVRLLKENDPDLDENLAKAKFVAYTSIHSNSSVEKSGMLGSVPTRLLPTDKNCSLRGDTLREAVEKDIANGKIPCYLVATFGTTGTCGFDNVGELAQVCKEYNIWLHIDAAYAGAALICPEFRYLMPDIDKADSFNVNCHKWMPVNFDCSAMWVKNANYLVDAFSVDRIYLKHNREQHSSAPDYRHWQIPLGRRFRAIKVWTTMRMYGADGLRHFIRRFVNLAEYLANLLRKDKRFELIPEPITGLVCCRIRDDDTNELTQKLLDKILASKELYVVPATFNDHLIIRFVVCSRFTEESDLENVFELVKKYADEILHPVIMDEMKCGGTNKLAKCHEFTDNLSDRKKPTVRHIPVEKENGRFNISKECCDSPKSIACEKFK